MIYNLEHKVSPYGFVKKNKHMFIYWYCLIPRSIIIHLGN
jgi:hypothetical protein